MIAMSVEEVASAFPFLVDASAVLLKFSSSTVKARLGCGTHYLNKVKSWIVESI